MGQGGHIVASSSLYGGSINLFTHTLPRFGITTSFVKPRDVDGFRNAIRPETRLVFAEGLGNPGLQGPDIPAVAGRAEGAGRLGRGAGREGGAQYRRSPVVTGS